jgi:abortive infection bacteriophage resistance protein
LSNPPRIYTKPALTPAGLLQHVVSRGLKVTDGIEALATLERIDYYRLLGYMRTYQAQNAVGVRVFRPGTTFDDVIALYEFDRKLRLLSLDAAERLEVALRAAIVSEVAVAFGPHFYLDSRHFTSPAGWQSFNEAVHDEKSRSSVLRFYVTSYDSPPVPPIWAAMEAVSFGTLSHLYSNLQTSIRKAIATRFGYDEQIVLSWFRSATLVRNLSAHHARLWNSRNGVDKPRRARKVREQFGDSRTRTTRVLSRSSPCSTRSGMTERGSCGFGDSSTSTPSSMSHKWDFQKVGATGLSGVLDLRH